MFLISFTILFCVVLNGRFFNGLLFALVFAYLLFISSAILDITGISDLYYILSMISLALSFIVARNKGDILVRVRCLSKFALVFLGLVVIVYLTSKRIELNWDEYSHWAHAIKHLYEYDSAPSATEPPLSHGAPWYPWGLASISYYGLKDIASVEYQNLPIILNYILLVLLSLDVGTLGHKKFNDKVFIITFCVIPACYPNSFFSGYADFSMNMSLLLLSTTLFRIAYRNTRTAYYVNVIGATILCASFKEAGSYLAFIVAVSVVIMRPRKKVVFSAFIVLSCVLIHAYIWRTITNEYTERVGRDVGLYFWDNVATESLSAFFSKFIYLQGHSAIAIAIISFVCLMISFSFKFNKHRSSSKLVFLYLKYFALLGLANLSFVVFSYIMTFSNGEFVNANSAERYMELTFMFVLVGGFLALSHAYRHWKFKLSYWAKPSVSSIYVLLIFSWSVYIVADSNKGAFLEQDIYPKKVANSIAKEFGSGLQVYYVDLSTSRGLQAIKINWFLNKSKTLAYQLHRSPKEFVLPDAIDGAADIIVLIDRLTNLNCYDASELITIEDSVYRNDYGVFYAFGPVKAMNNFNSTYSCER